MTTIHHRTCHICEANCGVLVEMDGRRVVSIKGNPDHVLSRGHICPKATAIADLQDDPDRLHRPVKRTADGWLELDWDTAYREIAQKVVALQGEGARAAFYRGNPGAHDYALSTQSGYLQRAVGARGTFSASTLDQIPHHYAQYQLYGHVSLAAVPDIDRSQLIVIVGGNPMASNGSLWTVPDFRNRVKEMQAHGITVGWGQDCVLDPWYSLGTADMLDVAFMGMHVAQMTSPEDMARCFDMVTNRNAQILGLEGYGLAPGKRASLVVLDAGTPIEALRLRPARLAVVANGKVISRMPREDAALALPGRPETVRRRHKAGR